MDELHVAFSKSDNKLIRYELAAGLLYNALILVKNIRKKHYYPL